MPSISLVCRNDLMERLLDRKITLRVMEDNEAAIRVIVTGHNPNMRHMSRTQRMTFQPLMSGIMLRIFAL